MTGAERNSKIKIIRYILFDETQANWEDGEWIVFWVRVEECQNVRNVIKPRGRTDPEKPILMPKGICACTVKANTL